MNCNVCKKIEEDKIKETEKALSDLEKDPDAVVS